MLVYERVSVVVSLTLIGLTLYFVLAFPAETAAFTILGSPLTLDSPRQWLVALLLGGLAMAGADAVMRIHPALTTRRLSYLATFWMLPGLLVFLATQTLGLAPNPVTWAVGLMVTGLLLWLTIIAEFWQIRTNPSQRYRWAYVWQQFIGYTMALLFFIIIYRTRSRSAISATGIMLVSGMIAVALLRQRHAIAKTWLFAGIIGLSLGQITWALNYWRIGALTAGLLLLLIFYVLVGLAQQQLVGKLSHRALWEFGSIAVVAVLVIFNYT
ncbi:MAG: hypothetical protein BroJett011_50810 [Chloroflexota bacterium]|nr:MAG: hypothetical protein BroJett011_50810 [Chloroflexota bacterium]